MQHLIVAIIFAICLYLAIRRVARTISRARKGDPRCDTCTETNCPLHQGYEHSLCNCDYKELQGNKHKNDIVLKNCKKTRL